MEPPCRAPLRRPAACSASGGADRHGGRTCRGLHPRCRELLISQRHRSGTRPPGSRAHGRAGGAVMIGVGQGRSCVIGRGHRSSPAILFRSSGAGAPFPCRRGDAGRRSRALSSPGHGFTWARRASAPDWLAFAGNRSLQNSSLNMVPASRRCRCCAHCCRAVRLPGRQPLASRPAGDYR